MKPKPFTLVEVAVAVAILMAVLGLAGVAFAGVQSAWRSVTREEHRLDQLQAVDRIMDTAVRNAVPFHWKDRNNKELLLFAGERDSLFLTSLTRVGDRAEGGIRFLRLYLDGGALIAEYRSTPVLPETDREQLYRETVAEGVADIVFRYADLHDGAVEWFDSWDAAARRNIPVAVQFEVEFSDGSREVWLRRTAGAGHNRQLGNRLPPVT